MSDQSRTEILSHTPVSFVLGSGEPTRIIIATLLRQGYSYDQVKDMMLKDLYVSHTETQRIIDLYKLKELV